jgi:hypothetical protein
MIFIKNAMVFVVQIMLFATQPFARVKYLD